MLEWIQNNLVLFINIIIIIACIIAIIAIRISKSHKKPKEVKSLPLYDDIIRHLGGIDNIQSVSTKGSRLSLTLTNYEIVNETKLQELGIGPSIKMSNKITYVIGEKASELENRINELKK